MIWLCTSMLVDYPLLSVVILATRTADLMNIVHQFIQDNGVNG